MKRILIAVASIAIASPLTGHTVAAEHFKGESLAKSAKLDIAKARSIALKARPGRITEEELEKEKGGSGLRYSFDILSNGTTYEVGVDANSGDILENGHEGMVSEAGEAVKEGAGRVTDALKKKKPD
ncbi:peptidase M4 [Caulobacter sp. CCUG 60055]|uniref:PepSY domain-containing protein n=1 Tax=Caulobacter sp. CCUG 60055 TaxID=2100090 RepID=UPI001FA73F01|nr:PepSY domain-containing protein [Caulobacter sp. CCUG 60055]MCI3179242.1 peptidase M4 [Caulobacter sp. CCUG 60055]